MRAPLPAVLQSYIQYRILKSEKVAAANKSAVPSSIELLGCGRIWILLFFHARIRRKGLKNNCLKGENRTEYWAHFFRPIQIRIALSLVVVYEMASLGRVAPSFRSCFRQIVFHVEGVTGQIQGMLVNTKKFPEQESLQLKKTN